jgi:hypothetical protein
MLFRKNFILFCLLLAGIFYYILCVVNENKVNQLFDSIKQSPKIEKQKVVNSKSVESTYLPFKKNIEQKKVTSKKSIIRNSIQKKSDIILNVISPSQNQVFIIQNSRGYISVYFTPFSEFSSYEIQLSQEETFKSHIRILDQKQKMPIRLAIPEINGSWWLRVRPVDVQYHFAWSIPVRFQVELIP